MAMPITTIFFQSCSIVKSVSQSVSLWIHNGRARRILCWWCVSSRFSVEYRTKNNNNNIKFVWNENRNIVRKTFVLRRKINFSQQHRINDTTLVWLQVEPRRNIHSTKQQKALFRLLSTGAKHIRTVCVFRSLCLLIWSSRLAKSPSEKRICFVLFCFVCFEFNSISAAIQFISMNLCATTIIPLAASLAILELLERPEQIPTPESPLINRWKFKNICRLGDVYIDCECILLTKFKFNGTLIARGNFDSKVIAC